MRANRLDVVQAFDEFITDLRINLAPITSEVVEKALYIQSQVLSLKAMDALQLVTALAYGSTVFITNDKRLNQLNHPTIITLDQWK